LAKKIDAGMQSKCNLTLIHNDFKRKKAERDGEEKGIEKKTEELNELYKSTNNLKQQIVSQQSELSERETTIKDKDKRIIDLKKKTQELEKFKFVLDYKIKELKRDIGPREIEIQKL
jgi:archaellum component FlaC